MITSRCWRGDESVAAGCAIRVSGTAQEHGADAGDSGLAGDLDRHQFCDLQRGGCVAVATVTLSEPGAAGGNLAAFSRDRNSSGLALSWAVHGSPKSEPLVCPDGDCTAPDLAP